MGNTVSVYRSEVTLTVLLEQSVCVIPDVFVSLCQVWRQCGCVFWCSSATHRLPEGLQDAPGNSVFADSPLLVCLTECVCFDVAT